MDLAIGCEKRDVCVPRHTNGAGVYKRSHAEQNPVKYADGQAMASSDEKGRSARQVADNEHGTGRKDYRILP